LKKLLLILLLSSITFAKTNVVVSIAPLKTFVEKIGGEKIDITLMVPQGSSPHTYEPKPSQMKAITQAQIYFSIEVEFEKIWLEKFKNQNKSLVISDVVYDMNKSTISDHHHDEEKQCKHIHGEIDPHIWVDPIEVKHIVKNIYQTLAKADSNSSDYYKKNLDSYLKELDELDSKIKEILKDVPKNATFMGFHPAWGYFAKRYNLTQLSVEVEGKSPKMKALIGLMKKAKAEKVQAIFTQPEFSDKSAQLIANNLGIKVIKASPLASNWAENLLNLAKAIANKE
jgi:zinc transport system substrate-binding protein